MQAGFSASAAIRALTAITLFFLALGTIVAQERLQVIQPEPVPSVFLGFGTGINHYTG